jgi:hypothetical protein
MLSKLSFIAGRIADVWNSPDMVILIIYINVMTGSVLQKCSPFVTRFWRRCVDNALPEYAFRSHGFRENTPTRLDNNEIPTLF